MKEFCLKGEGRINTALKELNERDKIDELFLKSIKLVVRQFHQTLWLSKSP